MNELPVVFLTFANDQYDKLHHLSREEDSITNALRPRAKKSHFFLEKQSIAEKEHFANAITEHWNEMVIFHFSGHANPEALAFSGGDGKVEGLSQLLKLQNKLQLVFLNGCSTYGHVKTYLEAGVPVILATEAPVNDAVATHFSAFFYEALSLEGVSIQEAFELAKGKIALLHHKKDVELIRAESVDDSNTRGIRLNLPEGEEGPFKWGLYYQDESALQWSLPYQTTAVATPGSRIDLTEALSNAFSPYCREIRNLRDREEEGDYPNPGEYRDTIIKCLPAPLGVQVRKLFIRLPENLGQVGKEHILQAVSTYNTLMELLAFTMLAQLWKAHLKTALQLPEATLIRIRQFFKLDLEERKLYNFVDLTRSIREVFEHNHIDFFIEELPDLKKVVLEDPDFVRGMKFMESMKWLLHKDLLETNALANNYLLAETYLSDFLNKLGFCARYRLTAIKRINLIQPRHKLVPVYSHTLVPLIACGTYDADIRPYNAYTYSRAVILLRSLRDVDEFLTLTPFIIDKNAYDDKSLKSSIFFFSHYDRQQDGFLFQNADRRQDQLLITKTIGPERKLTEQQNYHNEIIDQFDAFAELFFNVPFKDL